MKTKHSFPPEGAKSALGLVLLLTSSALGSFAQAPQPAITSISLDGSNVVVASRVPPGLRRITLECRERLGAGTWAPRVVARSDGLGGSLTFRLPRSRHLEVMRVRGDTNEPLPSSFYTGTNQFYEQPSSSQYGPRTPGLETLDAGNSAATPPDASRAVVESDIWKLRGQTLYFFNQMRGLQIIDLANPDAAVVRGTFDLPAAGEQMYLPGANHVVLLARNDCSSDQSQVIVVADTNGPPTVAARLPVPGYIQESRMVGSALYVASQTYRPVASSTNAIWEWGTLVSSFDLAEPASPVARGTLWYPGYGNVVMATDRLLFIVTQDPSNWWQSNVRSIDITAPDGTMRAYETIRTAGRVADQFKLNWEDGVFTSVSEDWHWNNGTRLVTKLETFRLSDPLALGPSGVVKLGELELGRGERLQATRFDGRRVYVVTFFQIDPLWVVDLSNPSTPRIAGSVDVPGWSTFIQPVDQRLVTIGIESNHVAVSLFDVREPAAPALLSRVRLGQNYSWSEANWDEKAFRVLPEAGLILVPFTGDTTNGYASRVQLVDLNATTLVARGVIEHQLSPRRATLYSDRILSISGWELLSVDGADRDHPLVRGTTPLAWPVDRTFLHGDFLLELSTSSGWWWSGESSPVLRIASADAANQILSRLALGNLPVLGATKRANRLYVSQGPRGWPDPWSVINAGGTVANRAKLMLTVIGLDELPAARILGQTQAEVDLLGWSADLQAVWPRTDILVWVGGGFDFWGGIEQPLAVTAGLSLVGRSWIPFQNGGGGHLMAFDVSDSAAPQFASEVNLGTNGWWGFSKAFVAEGLVYLSHQISESVPIPLSPPSMTGDQSIGPGPVTVDPAPGIWVSRSLLDVVDYADARDPLVRSAVSIPGKLSGLSHHGAVLYSVGTHFTTNAPGDWAEFLDASAYDGVAAHLIDSLALPQAWPRPLLVVETNILIGRSAYTNGWWTMPAAGAGGETHFLETWSLSSAGRFTRSGRVTVPQPVSALVSIGALAGAQRTDGTVELFDATDAAALRSVGEGHPAGCLWFDLNLADGQLGRGLWIPLGLYGVAKIPAAP